MTGKLLIRIVGPWVSDEVNFAGPWIFFYCHLRSSFSFFPFSSLWSWDVPILCCNQQNKITYLCVFKISLRNLRIACTLLYSPGFCIHLFSFSAVRLYSCFLLLWFAVPLFRSSCMLVIIAHSLFAFLWLIILVRKPFSVRIESTWVDLLCWSNIFSYETVSLMLDLLRAKLVCTLYPMSSHESKFFLRLDGAIMNSRFFNSIDYFDYFFFVSYMSS